MVSDGEHVAIGVVRLDNRSDVARLSGQDDDGCSDLALALRVIARAGISHVRELLGDFAFVAMHLPSSVAVAVCDVFSIRKLYYTSCGPMLALASRAEALTTGGVYSQQYLAELVSHVIPDPNLTAFQDVRALPAGSIATIHAGRIDLRQYWSAYDLPPRTSRATSDAELVHTCRELLSTAVRSRMPEGSTTWSQLSGGIDSSSIVGMAQWLAKSGTVSQGLAGTVTWADSHGMGADERGYSDAVAEHAHVRNETIVDVGLWADDGQPPPLTDQPEGTFSLYARQRKMCEIVTGAGGRVLLTGLGGDELFVGSMFFFADWLVAGRRWEAIREMAVRAAMGRVSFWELSYKNAILPLLPALLQRRLVRGEGQLPPWATERAVRSYDLRRRAFAPFVYAGRRGKKYEDAIAAAVTACRVTGAGGVIEDQLDVRHPYLYRPLVEFALTLPPETCVRPFQRKWILREAMKGILPDLVRCRIGKGLLAGAHAASITRDRSVIEPLLRDPILANLGVVSAKKLRDAFEAAQYESEGVQRRSSDIQHTLAIEAWLQVRAGLWSCKKMQSWQRSVA